MDKFHVRGLGLEASGRSHSFDYAYMSTNFGLQDVIAEDPHTHGSVFIPVVAGSDKTTVSVATGHQEYHPVYQSPGNFKNTARRAHGLGLMPVAFLPIPKSACISTDYT